MIQNVSGQSECANGHRSVVETVGIIGAGAFGIALAFVWANAMTRLVVSTIAGWYSLMHGLTHILGGRAGRRTA